MLSFGSTNQDCYDMHTSMCMMEFISLMKLAALVLVQV